MDETEQAVLDRKLGWLQEHAAQRPELTLIVFQEYPRKPGGAYVETAGQFRQLDPVNNAIILTDWRSIPLAYIREIRLPLPETEKEPDSFM